VRNKIAIIGGSGELGYGLAPSICAGGENVLIGSRDEKGARGGGAREGGRCRRRPLPARNNAAAAAQASIVILAVPFSAQAAILKASDRR